MVHIRHRDEASAVGAVADGNAQIIFATMAVAIDAVRAGKVRVLAVTTATRSEFLPDVPAVDEFVPGYVTFGFAGIGAPKNTPRDAIEVLNRHINGALDDPSIKADLSQRLLSPFHGSPEEFGGLVTDVIKMWGTVVKVSGVKPS